MTVFDHVVGYALVAAVWAVFCLTMSIVCVEDKKFSRLMVRGFWLSPIWTGVIVLAGIRGLCWLWRRAEWGK